MNKLERHLKTSRKLTELLDTEFNILGVRFGIDPILNVIPVFGSLISTFTSLYLFWIGYQLKVPTIIYLKMFLNIFWDLLLSNIPIVGIVFDIFYKSNVKNLAILENFYQRNDRTDNEGGSRG